MGFLNENIKALSNGLEFMISAWLSSSSLFDWFEFSSKNNYKLIRWLKFKIIMSKFFLVSKKKLELFRKFF